MKYKILGIILTLFGMMFPFGVITCKEILCEIFLCVIFVSVGLLLLIITPQNKKHESE